MADPSEADALLATQTAVGGGHLSGLVGGTKDAAVTMGQHRAAKASHEKQGRTFMYTIPPLIFTVIMHLYTFWYFHEPTYCYTAVVLFSALCLVFFVVGSQDDRHFSFLGVLASIALVFGVVGGLFNYSLHTEPYWYYATSREYTNTLPSEPAAAHADAGIIEFAANAQIDTSRSVGFYSNAMYCVAPILDPYSAGRVEYWAVGVDCCKHRSRFACDDAADAKAKGGLVVVEGGYFAPRNSYYYRQAVETAGAVYDLQSAQEPLFVRWVLDPVAQQSKYYEDGMAVFVGLVMAHLVLNGACAYVVNFAVARTQRAATMASKSEYAYA